MTTAETRWIEPAQGLEIRRQTRALSVQEQDTRLRAIGVNPDRYQTIVDPAFLIGLSIDAGIASGISAEGNVNMLTRLTQKSPLRLGEAFNVAGIIESVDEVPRGLRIKTVVQFSDLAGASLATVVRESLKPVGRGHGAGGAGTRPPNVIADVSSLKSIAKYQLTPEATWAYSHEGNAIHYEIDAAQAAGFRAPIIGGGQGVHYLTAALWDEGYRDFDLDIFFRRPIFWDQRVWVGVSEDAAAIGLIRDDKVGTEMQIYGPDCARTID